MAALTSANTYGMESSTASHTAEYNEEHPNGILHREESLLKHIKDLEDSKTAENLKLKLHFLAAILRDHERRNIPHIANCKLNLSSLNCFNCNILHLAIIYLQDVESVEIFLKAGADANSECTIKQGENEQKFTACDLAVVISNKKIARFLDSKNCVCSEKFRKKLANLISSQNLKKMEKHKCTIC